jgi:hypothetical protein
MKRGSSTPTVYSSALLSQLPRSSLSHTTAEANSAYSWPLAEGRCGSHRIDDGLRFLQPIIARRSGWRRTRGRSGLPWRPCKNQARLSEPRPIFGFPCRACSRPVCASDASSPRAACCSSPVIPIRQRNARFRPLLPTGMCQRRRAPPGLPRLTPFDLAPNRSQNYHRYPETLETRRKSALGFRWLDDAPAP